MYGWTDIVVDQLNADQLDQLAAGYMLLCEKENAVKKNVKALESLVQLFWHTPEFIAFRLMG